MHTSFPGKALGVGLTGQPVRSLVYRGVGVVLGQRLLGGLLTERLRATPRRFGCRQHVAGQHKCGQRERHERRSPRQRGDVTGDGEAESGAQQLAGQDVAVDLAPFGAGEVVTDEGGDHRARRSCHQAEEHTDQQQLLERADRRARDHGQSPHDDRGSERPRTVRPIRQNAERNAGHRAHHRGHGHEQTDVGIGDVESSAQLCRRCTDGRGVGAAHREHTGQDDDHPGALRSAEFVLHPPT